MKKLLAISAAAFLLSMLNAGQAHAGGTWLEFFFPSLVQKEADPMETLQAPFAYDPAKPPEKVADPAKVSLVTDAIPLDQPHRTNEEMASWLVTATSEAFTFNTNNFEQDFKKSAHYFTDSGKAEFQAFLEQNNIIKIIQSNKYQIRSFAQETPLLLNEGQVNGTWRWLYEIPVMVSYMERGVSDYKKAQPVNQLMMLTVQIGRADAIKGGEGALIERLSGKVQAPPKPKPNQ